MKNRNAEREALLKSTKEREGWSESILRGTGKVHYYKDGISLCKKVKDNKHLKIFEQRTGSIYFYDCAICVKKQQAIKDAE